MYINETFSIYNNFQYSSQIFAQKTTGKIEK